MNVLILAQYFRPTENACANRMLALAKALSRGGHSVTVLCGMPNYPDGIKPPEYRWRLFARESIEGIHVLRTYEFPTPNDGSIRRSLNYLSFVLSASLAAPFLPRLDALIVSSPPLMVTIPARVIATVKRCALVCDVRDIWPLSLYELGVISPEAPMARVLDRMEDRIYRRSSMLSAATRGIRDHIQQHPACAVREVPVLFAPNGIDGTPSRVPSSFEPDDDAFSIVFAGNHSHAQDLQQFMDFAERLLRDPDPRCARVRLVFVGDGEARGAMLAAVSEKGLNNVSLLGWTPKEETFDIVAKCDLALVSLKDLPLFRAALPSKTFEAMYFGTAILTNVAGELKDMLEDTDCGYFFAPHDYEGFRDAVIDAMSDEAGYQRRCENARRVAGRDYQRDRTMDEYCRQLRAAVQPNADTEV